VRRAEADRKELENAIAAEKKQLQVEYGEKKKKAEAQAAEREQIAKSVPDDLLDLYTRISRKHVGSALAEVREGQCRACGMRILPHTLQLLKTETDEEIFRCETCGRILYTLEPIPHAASGQPENGAATS
jgi:predicted  nucleic acid-binding Zn-ribbon protein